MRAMGWDGTGWQNCRGRRPRVITGWPPPSVSSLRRDSAMDDTGPTPRDGRILILVVGIPGASSRLRWSRDGQAQRKQTGGGQNKVGTYKSWKAPLDPTVVISSERVRRDCSRDRKAQTRGEKQSHK